MRILMRSSSCTQPIPQASPGRLLCHFFSVIATWPWPAPVMLNDNYSSNGLLPYDNEIWQPPPKNRPAHLAALDPMMPIITPSYPAYNSSDSVNAASLAVMREEFMRGSKILEAVVQRAESMVAAGQASPELRGEVSQGSVGRAVPLLSCLSLFVCECVERRTDAWPWRSAACLLR